MSRLKKGPEEHICFFVKPEKNHFGFFVHRVCSCSFWNILYSTYILWYSSFVSLIRLLLPSLSTLLVDKWVLDAFLTWVTLLLLLLLLLLPLSACKCWKRKEERKKGAFTTSRLFKRFNFFLCLSLSLKGGSCGCPFLCSSPPPICHLSQGDLKKLLQTLFFNS